MTIQQMISDLKTKRRQAYRELNSPTACLNKKRMAMKQIDSIDAQLRVLIKAAPKTA